MVASLVLLAQVALSAAPGGLPFEHTQNVVYGEAHGVGLIMDVFVPRGEKNGAAIIDVVSGAWYADRGKLAEHWAAGMYEFHCARGFTVFAVRPGSVSHFTGEEMLAHIRTALKFVRGRAAEYGIDPQRIGLVGASAGGHLATLAAVTAAPEDRVQAVAVFFPPTDFLDWNSDGQMPDFEEIGPLLFADSLNGRSEEDIRAKAAALSPARHRACSFTATPIPWCPCSSRKPCSRRSNAQAATPNSSSNPAGNIPGPPSARTWRSWRPGWSVSSARRPAPDRPPAETRVRPAGRRIPSIPAPSRRHALSACASPRDRLPPG